MGRKVKRVPFNFDWPLGQVWSGYLMPDRLAQEKPCPAGCDNGHAPRGAELKDLWYGKAPFRPEDTGSPRLTENTPAVRAFAERNVANSPSYYGQGERAIIREAVRLAELWNGQWCHHLQQEDVDALVEADRLTDFTHTWSRENGRQPKDPPYRPTAAEVNEWSLTSLGHDAINCSVVIRAKCEREGAPYACPTCDGHGTVEAYEGQRAEAEAWQQEEPPTGAGWQLWETVSEGSPISPVFTSPEGLARWMASPAYTWALDPIDYDTALRFVQVGSAPSMVMSAETGVVSGEKFVGQEQS